jgi:CubicO group peptidase (beta-lactamase class C family)
MRKARSILKVILFLFAIPLLCEASLPAQGIASKVDEYLAARMRSNHFSGSVLIAQHGKIVVAKGYGMADIEQKVPNMAETKFRLGSVTKQFTAMAILELEERGKLRVQDPICKYVSDCPKNWQTITIFNLLTHTSGIPNFTKLPDYEKSMAQPTTVPELLARFEGKPLDFPPGSQFNYSNSGYEVLGAILEKVSGESYQAFLKKNIFDILGMLDSGYDNDSHTIMNRAQGYTFSSDGLMKAPYIDMSIPFSAGGLYSTVLDLYKWDRALYTEKLVSKKSLGEMFTPFKGDYGFGWVITKEFDRKQMDHGGGINGFSACIRRFPDDDAAVIVLSNVDTASSGEISHDLAAILFGEKYDLPKEHHAIKLNPSIYAAYIGKYKLGPNFIITVTREGNKLMTQATGQTKVEIFPEARTRFFLKVVDAQIDFVKDRRGKVTGLILHQGGSDISAKKIQ